VLADDGAGADIGPSGDPHGAAQPGTRGDGDEVLDHVIVRERDMRHDRHVRADPDGGGDRNVRQQDGARPYRR
jgi:hypothetical protein